MTRRLPALRQFGIGLVVLFVWQWLVSLTHQWPSRVAFAHGHAVWNLERWLHLPNEVTVQGWAMPHPVLLRWCNGYYDLAHVLVTGLVLVALWLTAPDGYRRTRNLMLGTTFVSLLVELWQVAPPRLINVGVIDTAHRAGVSIYDHAGRLVPQFDALPSLHIGWALVAAYGLAQLGRGWRRLGVVHVLLTSLVVVITGNHSWLDIGAAFLVVGAVHATLGVLYARRFVVPGLARVHRVGVLPDRAREAV